MAKKEKKVELLLEEEPKQDSKLNAALKLLEKDYGKGVVIGGSDKPNYEDVISTGSIGLDAALGIGGLPLAKIVELIGWESSGKSTISLQLIANAQKKGYKCLLVDGENSFDEKYAKALGVNPKDMLYVQLDENGGERAYEVASRLIQTGGIQLCIIDSVNALQPKKVLLEGLSASTMGLHSRMMGQVMPQFNLVSMQNNCLCIFISQIREKIGVMFGCLHGDTLVNFVDGRSLPIREVVENKIKGKVWSWNENTRIFEEKKIVDWHYNGEVESNEDFIHIETTAFKSHSGRHGLTVTPDHLIMTDVGWKKAADIEIGDRVLSKYESHSGHAGEKVLKGCFVGDSHLSLRHTNTASLRFQDSANSDYVRWKMSALNSLKFVENSARWGSEYTYEFAKYKKVIGERDPSLVFSDGILPWISFAIWIMDDAHFQISHERYILSVKRFKNNKEKLEKIGQLFENLGLEFRINLNDGEYIFTVGSSKEIAKNICGWMPRCMWYKLPKWAIDDNEFRGVRQPYTSKIVKEDFVEVIMKRPASTRQMKQKGKYDISIKDNHNYMVGGVMGGVIVHNSPETTQGGNALKFYAHIRIDVRKSVLRDGEKEAYANKTRVKVIKNKMAPPFKDAEFNINFGQGIDVVDEIINLGSSVGILKKWGKTITLLDNGAGKETKYDIDEFAALLTEPEHPDVISLYSSLKRKIVEKLKTEQITEEKEEE